MSALASDSLLAPQYVDPRDPYHHPSIPEPVHSQYEQDTAKCVYTEHAPSAWPIGHYGQGTTRRSICGIPALLFMLMFGLVLIAISGAVGGGVAGSLASKECRDELNALKERTSASTPTTAPGESSPAASGSAAPADEAQPAGTITVPKTGCPEANGTTYSVTYGSTTSTFVKVCDAVIASHDMFRISAPSWSACMDACAEYSDFFNKIEANGSTPACAGVSWVPEWSLHPEYAAGNYSTRGSCWFKSSDRWKSGWVIDTEIVTAVRQA